MPAQEEQDQTAGKWPRMPRQQLRGGGIAKAEQSLQVIHQARQCLVPLGFGQALPFLIQNIQHRLVRVRRAPCSRPVGPLQVLQLSPAIERDDRTAQCTQVDGGSDALEVACLRGRLLQRAGGDSVCKQRNPAWRDGQGVAVVLAPESLGPVTSPAASRNIILS